MKKSKPKTHNAAELHRPHSARPELFVIEIAAPEGSKPKAHNLPEDRPLSDRSSKDRRAAAFIARPLRHKS